MEPDGDPTAEDPQSRREEMRRRIARLGFSKTASATLFDHFDDAERRGRSGHGFVRVEWLESQPLDTAVCPELVSASEGFERWRGNGALGYLVLAEVCAHTIAAPPVDARVVVMESCFPTGVLGYWAKLLADAGLVALLTATSPRRLPHPDGGVPLTGTNPLAIAVPSSDGQPLVADVSMGAVTYGDVLTGRAQPEELVPFGAASAHKAFALAAGLELVIAALAGPEHGAVLVVARPEHDPTPAFRRLADGRRLPGDTYSKDG